jgi:hypothetical protein
VAASFFLLAPYFVVEAIRKLVNGGHTHVPIHQTAGPFLYPLMLVAGGALAVVTHQACAHWSITEDDFLIAADGSLRRIATRHFPGLQEPPRETTCPGRPPSGC